MGILHAVDGRELIDYIHTFQSLLVCRFMYALLNLPQDFIQIERLMPGKKVLLSDTLGQNCILYAYCLNQGVKLVEATVVLVVNFLFDQ